MQKIVTLIKITTILEKHVAELLEITRQNWLYLPGDKHDKQIWWDNQEVMQKLHISASTLKRRRHQGIIPYTRNGGKLYYKPSDIEKAMERNFN